MKTLTNTLLAVFVMISICSCVDSDEKNPCPNPMPNGSDAQIYLRLQTPGGFTNPTSRSLTFEQENKINNIYVLVFNSANSLVAIKQGEDVSSTPGSTNAAYSGEGSFVVTLAASRNSSDTYNLVILANAASELAATIGTDETSSYINKSYAEVAAAIYGSISGKMYNGIAPTDVNAMIPMWGESKALVVEPGTNNKTVELTRAVARIDVGVGFAAKTGNAWSWNGLDANSENIPFVLGHVYVMRPNDRYAVMPNPGAAAEAPSIPAGTTAFSAEVSESTFAYSATASAAGGFTSQDIYIPESDILMGATGAPGDANHTNRMAIVVGGYYNGSTTETFYRLDFAVNKALINVLRNHLYQFSISKVSGAGYADVETAYTSQAMNMTVNIYDWNAIDMGELFLDGSKYVMLGQSKTLPNDERRMTVFRNVESQDFIEMRTNIPLDEFVMVLDNGGAFPDAANPKIIQNDRFKVELKTENATNYFVATALQPYDSAAANNPSQLTVTTGRITFVITIRQINVDSGDWNDGGNTDKIL